jgi:hypothetical protein
VIEVLLFAVVCVGLWVGHTGAEREELVMVLVGVGLMMMAVGVALLQDFS